jgi:hypothetical protein
MSKQRNCSKRWWRIKVGKERAVAQIRLAFSVVTEYPSGVLIDIVKEGIPP